MSKTYKVRVSNAEHDAMQGACNALNAKIGEPLWRPDRLALYLVVRSLELIEEDPYCIQRILLEPPKYDYHNRLWGRRS